MDYEKEYKEALERARALRNEAIENGYVIEYIKDYETIFPELRESEDERIRRNLIKFLTCIKEIAESGRTTWVVRKDDAEMCKSFLSYLKKQKEQQPVEWSEEDKKKINDISEIIGHGITIPYCGGTLTPSKKYKKELQCFIESLRPSLKPSEEQMKALDKAILCMGVVGRDAVAPLESLYEQLEKLI